MSDGTNVTTATRILRELDTAGYSLSDQDLAHRLSKPEPSIRRTRLKLLQARQITRGNFDYRNNVETYLPGPPQSV